MKSKGKKKKNLSVLELRAAADLTQGELAALIGASKIAVTSWERGVKRLSRQFAHRIHLATGASTASLLRGDGKNLGPFANRAYTEQTFLDWRKRFGGNAQAVAEDYCRVAADSVGLILRAAAASPNCDKAMGRLAVVWCSFAAWLDQTRQDFKLEGQIDDLLKQRFERTHALTKSYGEWRRLAKLGHDTARLYRFKDDRQQPASKPLTLYLRTRPGWDAAGDMRVGRTERACL